MSLKQSAKDVLEILERRRYVVGGGEVVFEREQVVAETGTRIYEPQELENLREVTPVGNAPRITVVDDFTQSAAFAMATSDGPNSTEPTPFGLLNFASARNPGGGFLNGAKAQEEDLCRCSGLYPCLLRCPIYYEANRKQDSLLYTDYAIFSPNVPFFKTSGTSDFLPRPFLASVITAPAPNSGPFLKSNPDGGKLVEATFLSRWENVLCIARDQGIKRLLLGAWGCGAFGGDPAIAAKTAKAAIQRLGSAFDEIVFAIPGKGQKSQSNLHVFQAVLG